MPLRDLQRHFRAAPWTTPVEVRAFVTEASPVAPSELVGLLALLQDRALVAQSAAHRARCSAFAQLVDAAPSEELYGPFARALKSAEPSLRQALVAVLPKVGRSADHQELCALLGNSELELRRAASEVLKQIGGRSALNALVSLMSSASFPGRLEALAAMVPRAGAQALPLIAATLKHGKPQERATALRYIVEEPRMAKERAAALRVAASALEDEEERVAAAAVAAFGAVSTEEELFRELGSRLDDPSPLVVRAVVESLGRHRTARSVAALGRKLRQGPTPVRIAVLDALRAMGGGEVLPVIADALAHRQQVVRNKAAEVLWELARRGDVELARMILWLLRSADVNVRRVAVELAKKMGDPKGELAPRLLVHLRDEDWWVRERVVDAVIEMMGADLTRHLVPFLADPSDVIRRWAIGALTRVRDPRALGALVRAAQEDTDWWVREQAIEACATLGDARAVPYIVHLMRTEAELRVVCLQALGTMKAVEAAASVAECLADPDSEVRLGGVRCLEAMDARAFAPRVQTCVNDPEPRVHRAATAVLTTWNELRRGLGATGLAAAALDRLLVATGEARAEDLMLTAGRPPFIKVQGAMQPLQDAPISESELREMLFSRLTRDQLQALEGLRDLDFSYEVKAADLRFRANVFRQATGLGAVFRLVRNEVPSLDDLGLPPIVAALGGYRHGLVLVGGPTGSGKSTTLAALIADINRRTGSHILTFEDPIEVVHRREASLINQREMGTHVRVLGRALRAALREDPDVILMGEMRDVETLAFAITAAETGHLVFATVHTVSADTSIDRIINAFPSGQQAQVRTILADALRAVVCQHLLRRADGPGRIAAVEVLVNNDAVANLIRKGKTFQIPSVIATAREAGMQSMDGELLRLLREGRIHADEAYMKAVDKKQFESHLPPEQRGGEQGGAHGGTHPQQGATPTVQRGVPAPRGG